MTTTLGFADEGKEAETEAKASILRKILLLWDCRGEEEEHGIAVGTGKKVERENVTIGMDTYEACRENGYYIFPRLTKSRERKLQLPVRLINYYKWSLNSIEFI